MNHKNYAKRFPTDTAMEVYTPDVLDIPQLGWPDPTNFSTDKSFDASATTLTEIANVLATLIVTLKNAGILAEFQAGNAMGVLGLTYS